LTAIEHVVFDLGQVLIRWDPEAPYRRLIPDDAVRKSFLAEIVTHDWNLEQDRGRSWTDAEAALIAQYPQHGELIRAYRGNWHEMVPGLIDENVGLLEELINRGVDVTALTNWATDTFAETEQRFHFLSRFRGITVSGRVKLIKPDPAIFRHHAETFGLKRRQRRRGAFAWLARRAVRVYRNAPCRSPAFWADAIGQSQVGFDQAERPLASVTTSLHQSLSNFSVGRVAAVCPSLYECVTRVPRPTSAMFATGEQTTRASLPYIVKSSMVGPCDE
jgi:FMN phosphatase YigB (HAD superfamily)